MGLIREELRKVAKNWNLHKIRPSNTDTPHGRPDTLFFLPEEAGATDFKKDADVNDLEVAENSVCGELCHPLGCSLAFVSLQNSLWRITTYIYHKTQTRQSLYT